MLSVDRSSAYPYCLVKLAPTGASKILYQDPRFCNTAYLYRSFEQVQFSEHGHPVLIGQFWYDPETEQVWEVLDTDWPNGGEPHHYTIVSSNGQEVNGTTISSNLEAPMRAFICINDFLKPEPSDIWMGKDRQLVSVSATMGNANHASQIPADRLWRLRFRPNLRMGSCEIQRVVYKRAPIIPSVGETWRPVVGVGVLSTTILSVEYADVSSELEMARADIMSYVLEQGPSGWQTPVVAGFPVENFLTSYTFNSPSPVSPKVGEIWSTIMPHGSNPWTQEQHFVDIIETPYDFEQNIIYRIRGMVQWDTPMLERQFMKEYSVYLPPVSSIWQNGHKYAVCVSCSIFAGVYSVKYMSRPIEFVNRNSLTEEVLFGAGGFFERWTNCRDNPQLGQQYSLIEKTELYSVYPIALATRNWSSFENQGTVGVIPGHGLSVFHDGSDIRDTLQRNSWFMTGFPEPVVGTMWRRYTGEDAPAEITLLDGQFIELAFPGGLSVRVQRATFVIEWVQVYAPPVGIDLDAALLQQEWRLPTSITRNNPPIGSIWMKTNDTGEEVFGTVADHPNPIGVSLGIKPHWTATYTVYVSLEDFQRSWTRPPIFLGQKYHCYGPNVAGEAEIVNHEGLILRTTLLDIGSPYLHPRWYLTEFSKPVHGQRWQRVTHRTPTSRTWCTIDRVVELYPYLIHVHFDIDGNTTHQILELLEFMRHWVRHVGGPPPLDLSLREEFVAPQIGEYWGEKSGQRRRVKIVGVDQGGNVLYIWIGGGRSTRDPIQIFLQNFELVRDGSGGGSAALSSSSQADDRKRSSPTGEKEDESARLEAQVDKMINKGLTHQQQMQQAMRDKNIPLVKHLMAEQNKKASAGELQAAKMRLRPTRSSGKLDPRISEADTTRCSLCQGEFDLSKPEQQNMNSYFKMPRCGHIIHRGGHDDTLCSVGGFVKLLVLTGQDAVGGIYRIECPECRQVNEINAEHLNGIEKDGFKYYTPRRGTVVVDGKAVGMFGLRLTQNIKLRF